MSAVVFDTETTGFEEPDVIQLAACGPFATPDEARGIDAKEPVQHPSTFLAFKPRKPISFGAMATHHILDSDLATCREWTGSWTPPAGTEYLIAHNVDFDWQAIGSPHLARICTVHLARALWPDCDSHSLGALTYYLNDRDLARHQLRSAHSAAADTMLCYRLLQHILKALPAVQTWHDLWRASEKARVPLRLSFGKYGPHEDWAKANGGAMLCAEVRQRDNSYFWWLMNKCDQVREDPYLRKALTGEAV